MESPLAIGLLVLCLAGACSGAVLFSSLPRTFELSASPQQGQVFKAGEDTITVTWSLNQTTAAAAATYKAVKVTLCYGPASQIDRSWRKTNDNLSKDKTCQFTIVKRPYEASLTAGAASSVEWKIERDIPTATYFVRVYAYNAAGDEVAYGQNTDDRKEMNLFEIESVSGRSTGLEIASISFSAFALLSLFALFLREKVKRV